MNIWENDLILVTSHSNRQSKTTLRGIPQSHETIAENIPQIPIKTHAVGKKKANDAVQWIELNQMTSAET